MQLVHYLLVVLVLLLGATNGVVSAEKDRVASTVIADRSSTSPVIAFTNLKGSQPSTDVTSMEEERAGVAGGTSGYIGGTAVSSNPVTDPVGETTTNTKYNGNGVLQKTIKWFKRIF